MTKIIQVTTYPFGTCNKLTRDILQKTGWDVRYNPYKRRLKPTEVKDLVTDAYGIIAGTEPYTKEIIDSCKNLKVLSRVGVGFENVDIEACHKRGIIVTYTPEAPVQGVAELTMCQILNLLRGVLISNNSVRDKEWNRYIGFLISEVKIGILGVGRIGGRLAKMLQPFAPQLYGCDIAINKQLGEQYNINWLSHDELFKTCDVITVHVPLNDENFHLVGTKEFEKMQPGSFFINLSRGPVVDEVALIKHLESGHLSGAALDVFEQEPYIGRLTEFNNVVLTAHIGASARHTRFLMELGAAEDCVRVLSGLTPYDVIE